MQHNQALIDTLMPQTAPAGHTDYKMLTGRKPCSTAQHRVCIVASPYLGKPPPSVHAYSPRSHSHLMATPPPFRPPTPKEPPPPPP